MVGGHVGIPVCIKSLLYDLSHFGRLLGGYVSLSPVKHDGITTLVMFARLDLREHWAPYLFLFELSGASYFRMLGIAFNFVLSVSCRSSLGRSDRGVNRLGLAIEQENFVFGWCSLRRCYLTTK